MCICIETRTLAKIKQAIADIKQGTQILECSCIQYFKMYTNQLSLNRKALMIAGCWPLKFENPSARFKCVYGAYQIFTKFWIAYVVVFVITSWIQIYFIPFTNLEELVQNISTNLVYTVGIYQLVVCKQGKAIRIIKTIYKMEREVLQANNEEHVRICKYYRKLSNTVNKLFAAMSTCTVSLIIFLPLMETKVEIYFATTANGQMGKNVSQYLQRRLPLSSWFPFDKSSHYTLAYILQGLGGYSGCSFVIFSDIFFFSIMLFALGQIKILQNQIENFKETSEKKCKSGNGVIMEEIAVLRECVRKHKMIIE